MPGGYIPRLEIMERECWKFLDWRLNSDKRWNQWCNDFLTVTSSLLMITAQDNVEPLYSLTASCSTVHSSLPRLEWPRKNIQLLTVETRTSINRPGLWNKKARDISYDWRLAYRLWITFTSHPTVHSLLEKISWEGEFTLGSDPWAGLIASCGSF